MAGRPTAGAYDPGHLVMQPRQVEHPIDPSQHMIVRNKVAERPAEEEFQLFEKTDAPASEDPVQDPVNQDE